MSDLPAFSESTFFKCIDICIYDLTAINDTFFALPITKTEKLYFSDFCFFLCQKNCILPKFQSDCGKWRYWPRSFKFDWKLVNLLSQMLHFPHYPSWKWKKKFDPPTAHRKHVTLSNVSFEKYMLCCYVGSNRLRPNNSNAVSTRVSIADENLKLHQQY